MINSFQYRYIKLAPSQVLHELAKESFKDFELLEAIVLVLEDRDTVDQEETKKVLAKIKEEK